MGTIKKTFKYIQHLNLKYRYVVLTAATMLFMLFASLCAISINWSGSPYENTRLKAKHTASLIVSTNIENMMDYNTRALKKTARSFMEDKDIESIIIKDGSNAVLVKTSKQSYKTQSIIIKKDFIAGNMKIGTLELTVTDASKWEKYRRVADLIASSSVEHIWDYNISSLKSSALSFFKNENIHSLKIKEESGIELIRFEKEKTEAEKLIIKRKLFKDKRFIGSLEITFCDCAETKREKHRQKNLTIYSILTGLMGILIIFLIRNNRKAEMMQKQFSLKREIEEKQTLHWSISETTETKMKQAIEYLKDNYTSTISREGLASMLNLNPDNMGRYFKIYTGEKINDFINRLRIEDAAQRLQATDENIVDIAFAVGFENISTFNRSFQKIMEITPTEYRKLNS